MKKITIFLLFTLIIAGTVFAQPVRDQRREINPRLDHRIEVNPQARAVQFNANPITVSGTLKLQRGMIAVESGDSVYYVPMLNRYVGFINGLTEGAEVSVEGLPYRNIIRPTKLTIGGRSYDFPAQRMNQPQMTQQNQRQRIENHGKNQGHGRNQGHHRHNHHNHGNRNNQNRSSNCCRR